MENFFSATAFDDKVNFIQPSEDEFKRYVINTMLLFNPN